MKKELKSQVDRRLIALVTGANQGVGFEIAKALIAADYTVYLGSRKITNGEIAAAKLGVGAYPVHLDVTNQSTIHAAMDYINKQSGSLDLLVNNAGISYAGKPGLSVEEILSSGKAVSVPLDEVRAVWETNVFGVIAVTQSALPLLRKSKAARVINLSSPIGSLTYVADPNWPGRMNYGLTYGASKTALNAVTLAFAIDLEKENIKVNAVSPGYTATALNNFQGTDSLEEGSREPIRVALEMDGLTARFTGPDGVLPW